MAKARKKPTTSNDVVRNRRGISTRRSILAAADRLLQKKGLEAMSLDAVARAARVSRSSVYHQFGSRDGLFLELIGESLRRLQEERRPHQRRETALERFLFDAETGFEANPELLRLFYQLVFFDRSWSRPQLRSLLREGYRHRTERIARGLLRDAGGNASDEDAEDLAVVLVAILDGLYTRSQVDLDRDKLRRVLQKVALLVGEALPPLDPQKTGQH